MGGRIERIIRRARVAIATLASAALALVFVPAAAAAGPPQIAAVWSSEVAATSARLGAQINPEGATTTYHFEYLTQARFELNGGTFAGAARAPAGAEPSLGSSSTVQTVFQLLTGLAAETTYRYRVLTHNASGTVENSGPVLAFTTEALGGGPVLADGRGWEMVSPVDKNGGQVDGPGQISGGGVLQAAADGEAVTWGSTASFGTGAQGAPVASQYLSRRGAGGWSAENITLPTVSGAYGDKPNGVPYQLFSTDLARALLLNGRRCAEGEPCPRSFSLRDSGTGALTPLPAQAAGMRVLGASPDLGHIFFEDEETAQNYEWSGGSTLVAVSLPPPSPGVLGTSADGKVVYEQTGTGLFVRREGGSPTEIAPGAEAAQPSDYPAATGTARVSADGQDLLFLSRESLTGYDNTDQTTRQPDTEVYLYTAGGSLSCVSCNPTGERPIGPSTIPGAIANGAAPGSTDTYKPRNLADGGNRVFFESADALVLQDTDNRPDAYEWEAQGVGTCSRAGGCLSLISSGRSPEGATFIDASADGADAFFLTDGSLVGTDPGSIDLYDARIGGGFPEPSPPIACEGDACQSIPPEPEDPTPGTLSPGSGQPPLHFPKHHRKKHHEKHRRHHHKRHRRGGR